MSSDTLLCRCVFPVPLLPKDIACNGLLVFLLVKIKYINKRLFISALVFGQWSLAGTIPNGEGKNAIHHADLVWTQYDGLREEIFLSTYAKGKWEPPVQLTDDNAQNLHPAVDTDANGIQWVAWTAIEDGTSSICAMSINRHNEKSEIHVVSADQPNNIYPTVIIDYDNIPWIIWSATVGTNDDIFFSRYHEHKWQKPQPLHQPNNVPDVRPVVELSDDGLPVVEWQRFIDGGYQDVSSSWQGTRRSVPVLVEQKDTISPQSEEPLDVEEQLSLPDTTKTGQNLFIKIYN